MDIKQTTTAFELPGCKITGNKGVVRGVLVRSRSIFGNIGAAFQTLAGGNITLYTELCEKTRRNALELMIAHAEAVGGNAVIGNFFEIIVEHVNSTETDTRITSIGIAKPIVMIRNPHLAIGYLLTGIIRMPDE